MRRHHAIDRSVVLAWIQLGVHGMRVVQHLHFAHAGIGGVTLARIADGQAVVAAGWELVLDASDEVGVFILGVDDATLLRTTDDSTVLDLVVLQRPSPSAE